MTPHLWSDAHNRRLPVHPSVAASEIPCATPLAPRCPSAGGEPQPIAVPLIIMVMIAVVGLWAVWSVPS